MLRNDRIIRPYRQAWAPEEIVIQTLVHNSEWSSQTEFHAAEERQGREMQQFNNFHYLKRLSDRSPLTLNDLQAVSSSGKYFARKFELSQSATLMEHVCPP
jgi:hypothetical protein